ncbi:TetR/AcrR family transcriptional regulator [Nocardia sp. 2]|uniref:TetR/AcrR family transcriptional regulator n=1 Tax=Nocardia acididurans TaxID=2802282 RepID=A0ABS1M1T0_9NOCA|nr:TetR/AcrR family transcriptional regulator [Nocardia acididurans]MBL1074461.1 TetR/AcrR family transcriptional regulator [Nocardia acididurans]
MSATSSSRTYDGRPVVDRRADRRIQFLGAGLTVFGEGGYQDSSITSLCKAAGLARSQFYEHFANREALLLGVYDMIQADARAAVTAAVAATDPGDAVGRARAAVVAYAESVGGDVRRARISFVEIVGVSAEVEQHRVEQRRRWVEFFTDEMRRSFGDGYIPPGGYPSAAMGFIGALMALVHQWSTMEPRGELADVVEVLTRFLASLMPIQTAS